MVREYQFFVGYCNKQLQLARGRGYSSARASPPFRRDTRSRQEVPALSTTAPTVQGVEHPPTPTLVERLAERLDGIRYEVLPADVIDRAKLCLLDQLGIQLFGTTVEQVQPGVRLARSIGGTPESSVPLSAGRLPAPYAAYAASALGHSCEFDDVHGLCGHPGVTVIPVVLAVGEKLGVSGAAALTALVRGYEAMCLSCGPVHRGTLNKGWHPVKVSGVFGASAAAASLMLLDPRITAQAFTIAASDASGTMEYDRSGGEVKRLHPAMAARSGIQAALLAADGLTGPLTIMEGQRGILRLFGDGSEPQIDEVWGTEYHIRDINFKLYPTVVTHQSSIEAVRHLLESEHFTVGDVDKITVSVPSWAVLHGGETGEPHDMISAQFNLGFSLAVRVVRGSNALQLYRDPEQWSDSEIRSISSRVTVQALPEALSEPSRQSTVGSLAETLVQVDLKDGRQLSRRQRSFRGHAAEPAQFADIEGKFLTLVDGIVPASRAREIIRVVSVIEDVADIRELTALLQPVS
jgi:2-methylcitrate dehydratase PrpD